MGYKFWCSSCSHNYYTVSSSTWNTSGTVKVYPSYGYCSECCGRGYTSWSYSGNVVKLECHACSNLIGVVSWNDWRNSSGESTGYCNGCYDSYKSEQEKERIRREERERQQRERERQQREDDAQTKPHYCPKSYSFNKPNWANVEYSIDSYYYLWKYCKIYCKAKNHQLFYKLQQDFEKEPNVPNYKKDYYGNKFHKEITQILSDQKCSQCKEEKKRADDFVNEQKQAKQKCGDIEKKYSDLFSDGSFEEKKNSDTNYNSADNIENIIKNVDKFESDINGQIQQLVDLKAKASDVSIQSQNLIGQVLSKPTYTNSDDFDNDIQKLQNMATEAAKQKKNLFKQQQDLKKKENELIDEETKTNKEIKAQNERDIKNNDKRQKLDEMKKAVSDSKISSKIGGDALKKLNEKIDNLYNELLTQYSENQQRTAELQKSSKRIKKIRSKLKHEKSECVYFIELLNDEMKRLSNATDEAMDKFEKRTTYFLCAIVGLSDEMVSKFVEDGGYELEDIMELTDAELENELEIEDSKVRGKILRHIKRVKKKPCDEIC